MAASDNMASIETWAFRSVFENSWISEAFARDTEALTKALTVSISSGPGPSPTHSPPISEYVSFPPETPTQQQVQHQVSVQSVSSSGGSDPETPSVSKRPPRNPASASGKITKRKSRASKRSPTTFITADPANFRQMVQQVTGVRFGSGTGPILKPEPQRRGVGFGVVSRLQGVGGGCLLPTLDTSAFLLDHHQEVVGPSKAMGGAQGNGPLGFGSGGVMAEAGGPGFDFDGFSCFPTLESCHLGKSCS